MNESKQVPRKEWESDLYWLARNVHAWPAGDHQPWCYVYWKGGQRAVSGNCITVIQPCVRVEMSDWLARRAELQNKPSWDDFGESAKFMAQDSDGAWMAFESEPSANYHVWSSMRGWCGYAREGRDRCRGEVLGDWRDTLEKRPEEFKPLTSIEDNQEKDMTKQQEMKQDNKWFERGELPPVGTECEIDLGAKWRKVFVVGHNYTGRIVVEVDTCNFIVADGCTFRPIRTERDKLVELIKTYRHTFRSDTEFADVILSAGFSLGAK